MSEGLAHDHAHNHAHDHAHDHHDHARHDHGHAHHHQHHTLGDSDLRLIAFDAFGVPMAISAPDAILPRVENVLPPGWTPREPREGDEFFRLTPRTHQEFRVERGATSVSGSADLQVALEVLADRIREHVASSAPNHVFVHAGAVGYNGRAILIPGLSFSGKTTLVTELVRRGATYYSDEYAVLDEKGLVHPYAKPLSIRNAEYEQVPYAVESIGGTAGVEPLPVGVVALAWYEIGATWNPKRLSGGEAALALMSNTFGARERPEQSLSAITKAVSDAIVLEGTRGEVAEVAPQLLGALDT